MENKERLHIRIFIPICCTTFNNGIIVLVTLNLQK